MSCSKGVSRKLRASGIRGLPRRGGGRRERAKKASRPWVLTQLGHGPCSLLRRRPGRTRACLRSTAHSLVAAGSPRVPFFLRHRGLFAVPAASLTFSLDAAARCNPPGDDVAASYILTQSYKTHTPIYIYMRGVCECIISHGVRGSTIVERSI